MNLQNRIAQLPQLAACFILLAGLLSTSVNAQTNESLISMTMRDTELAEVMEMLSRAERVNILLSGDVGGEVSFSLYDVPLSEAIPSSAETGLISSSAVMRQAPMRRAISLKFEPFQFTTPNQHSYRRC